MVAIRRSSSPAPTTSTSSSSDVRSLTNACRPLAAPLPRSTKKEERPTESAPNTWFGRLMSLFRKNDKAVAGVLLGASALSGLSGCAATHAGTRIETMTPRLDSFESLKAEAAKINAKKDTVPHTDLNAERQKVYDRYVASGQTFGLNVDEDHDGLNLVQETLYGTSDAKADSDGDKMSDGFEVKNGLDPASAQEKGRTSMKGWTHNYIPMSNNPMIEENTMLFYDMLMKSRTGVDPKLRHVEGASALENGHYFLSSTLDENNAELTSGKDMNGDGVLTPGVKHDFLTPAGAGDANFGTDNKTETTLNVGWWGHCNDVATAGINFREPTKSVTFKLDRAFDLYTVSTTHGTYKAESVKKGATHTDIKLVSGQVVRLPNADVTDTHKESIKELEFTPRMLKELVSELVHRGSKDGTDFIGNRFNGRDAILTLTDGSSVRGALISDLESSASDISGEANVTAKGFTKDVQVRVFDFAKGEYVNKTFKPSEIKSITAENKRDVEPVTFHLTMLKWLGSDGKAAVMDKDAGPHVWNYSFDKYDLASKARAGDPNTVDYTMGVYFVGNSWPTEYKYSITFENGAPKKGAWASESPNPDFFWRDRGGAEGFDHDHAGNATPIKAKTVFELLKASYAAEDAPAR